MSAAFIDLDLAKQDTVATEVTSDRIVLVAAATYVRECQT
jgi:hypothetical protein